MAQGIVLPKVSSERIKVGLGGNLGGDVNPPDLQKYVGDLDFPVDKEEVASRAEQNGAPQQMVGRIRDADKQEFANMPDLQSTIGNVL